jgi:RNA polymerase-binding transcription factor DksA
VPKLTDDHEHILLRRGRQLRDEIRAALLRVDAERNALLAEQVHDTKDQSVMATLIDSGVADVARDARELLDVEHALERLRGGNYGICTDCNASIPAARLAAWPAATRCLPCQQRHEHAGRG